MSASLQFVGATAPGFMPMNSVTALATANALQTTTQLAQSGSDSGSQILAAASPTGPVPTATAAPASVSADTPQIAALRQRANKACFVDRNPQQCSVLNQQLAAAVAARSCTGGDISNRIAQAKRRGSVMSWFTQPTWVAPVNPTTKDTASVGLSLATITPTVPIL